MNTAAASTGVSNPQICKNIYGLISYALRVVEIRNGISSPF